MARMALDHGINANFQRKWVDHYRGAVASVTAGHAVSLPVFAPVISIAAPEPVGSALSVALPNGIKLELRRAGPDDLPALLGSLAGLPGSASTTRLG